MADLKSLNELAEQAVKDVEALESKKEALRQDCIVLEAKKAHALEEMNAAQAATAEARNTHRAVVAEYDAELRSKFSAHAELENDIAKLTQDRSNAQEAFTAQVASHELELAKVQSSIEEAKRSLESIVADENEKRQAIEALVSDTQTKSTELSALDREIETKQAAAKADLAELSRTRDEAERELAGVRAETEEKTRELAKLLEALRRAGAELEQAKIGHSIFTEYEKRATKALRAYEASILDREQKLQIDSRSARRRGSILDNLD